MKSPYEQAYDLYMAHNPTEQSFSWYCGWHMQNAFLYSTPEFFIMGRPAIKQSLENIGPTLAHERFPDTWFIHCMAGNMRGAWTILPYYLPWVGFQRWHGGELCLTIVLTDRIRNLTELVT